MFSGLIGNKFSPGTLIFLCPFSFFGNFLGDVDEFLLVGGGDGQEMVVIVFGVAGAAE